LLIAGLFATSLAPAAAMAKAGSTYQVPGSTGIATIDTGHIQAGLDWCVTQGPGCTVQLQAGTYVTNQLVEYNFNGTLKGAGEYLTTIQAAPNLTVSWAGYNNLSACAPNTTTCLWPMLVMFVNGTVEVSDLTISEPNTGANAVAVTANWTNTGLYDLLAFTGQSRTNASVDRVSILGVQDFTSTGFSYGYESPPRLAGASAGDVATYCADSPPSPCWGWNVINGIDYSGFYPNGLTVYPLTGSFSVRDSTISWAFNPLALDGPHLNDQVTIGGAPGAGNTLSNAVSDIDLESAQSSTFDISYNAMSGTNTGMWVSYDPNSPTSPSQYRIHDNQFAVEWGCGCAGVELYDNPTAPYIQARIWNNTISAAEDNDGIDIVDTSGVTITGNTMTSPGGYDGIGLVGATLTSVIANDVSGFGIDVAGGGSAQIWLSPYQPATESWSYYGQSLPAATNNHVVCAGPGVSVLDQGTGNHVTGCGPANPKGGGHHLVAPARSTRSFTDSLKSVP
jgi:hypothetical protein